MFGRKKLLTTVAAMLYGQNLDGTSPEGLQNCIEEADHLIEAVRKYKRSRLDPADARKADEFFNRRK